MKFRKAQKADINKIWEIILFGIQSRKKEGSTQWQDGYPNAETIANDVDKQYGYVITLDNKIAIYAAIQTNPEPTYSRIDGAWLTSQQPYITIHRMAVSPLAKGKGMAKHFLKEVENLAAKTDFESIRIDTHEDNQAMLHIVKSLDYAYCGQIFVRGEARQAFEKIIK